MLGVTCQALKDGRQVALGKQVLLRKDVLHRKDAGKVIEKFRFRRSEDGRKRGLKVHNKEMKCGLAIGTPLLLRQQGEIS